MVIVTVYKLVRRQVYKLDTMLASTGPHVSFIWQEYVAHSCMYAVGFFGSSFF